MFESYPHYEIWLARLQLICFMLGMGVNLAITDFAKVLRQPRSLIVGFIAQVFMTPLLAVAVNRMFGLEPAIALGLIMVAAMPGGSLAKVVVYLGRGNAPLTITLCAFATLATLVTVPTTLRLLAADLVPADFTMPIGAVVFDVVVFLLTPVMIGMVVRRYWPRYKTQINRWSVRLGFVFLAAIIIGSIGSQRIRPGEYGLIVPLAIILFCMIAPQLAMLPFYVTNWPRGDRLAVGIEVTMRNINLGLLLNTTLFHDRPEVSGGVLFALLFYAAVALVAAVPLTLNHRRLAKRETPVQDSV